MYLLETRDLCKTYQQGQQPIHALVKANIQVKTGEFVSIVGRSGSGKSTLLHLLGGLDQPTSGQVFINNQDLYALSNDERSIFRRREIGFVFQNYNLLPMAREDRMNVIRVCPFSETYPLRFWGYR